jgi:hypothetical protein
MQIYKGFSTPIATGLHTNQFRTLERKPRDLDSIIHTIADQWFLARFGIRARSSCLICTTDIEQARTYARGSDSLKLIIPVDPCRIIYSEQVFDMHSITDACPDPFNSGAINDWLAGMCYKCVDDPGQISDGHRGELMVDCGSFYAASV